MKTPPEKMAQYMRSAEWYYDHALVTALREALSLVLDQWAKALEAEPDKREQARITRRTLGRMAEIADNARRTHDLTCPRAEAKYALMRQRMVDAARARHFARRVAAREAAREAEAAAALEAGADNRGGA